MIHCAALVQLNPDKDKILLVRVRDNKLWYLPGGKIEPSETAPEALYRELCEELSIMLDIDSIQHVTTIISPAYPQDDLVELQCFSASWTGEIIPQAEISEVQYLPLCNTDQMAPAVIKLVEFFKLIKKV